MTIEWYTVGMVGKYQSGFRKGKSTIDQISLLIQALEKTCEYRIDTQYLFIYFKCTHGSLSKNNSITP